MHEVDVVLEDHIGPLQDTSAFHINGVGGVHQNVVDSRVLEQRLQRPQPKHFVQHFIGNALALHGAERDSLLVDQLENDPQELLAGACVLHKKQLFEIDFVNQVPMDRRLHLLLRASNHLFWAAVGRARDAVDRGRGCGQLSHASSSIE